MTAAQKDYCRANGINPWSLDWTDAADVGFKDWGCSEAALLPGGRVLLADGSVAFRESGETK
jgi:hypothetical protein